MKKVVYTCVTGEYDTLNEVVEVERDIDYLCFTDRDCSYKTWETIKISNTLNLDNCRLSRYPKILPNLFLEKYDLSVWVDASVTVLGNINSLLNSLDSTCFHICKHSSRNCIYKEAEAIIHQKKDSKELIEQQISKYKKEGYPENFGLVAGGVIIRNHNDKLCISVMEQWWNEVVKFSKRDQLSFNYVAWKNQNFKFELIGGHKEVILNSNFFRHTCCHKK